MSLLNLLNGLTRGLVRSPKGSRRLPKHRPLTRGLWLEQLENRLCLSTLIDARALTIPSVLLDSTTSFSTAQVQTLNLSAGSHTLMEVQGLGQVTFNVAADGTVSFDSSETGVLAVGPTPSTLLVNGATIAIDARALTVPAVNVDFATNLSTSAPIPVTLLPAGALIQSSTTSADSWRR